MQTKKVRLSGANLALDKELSQKVEAGEVAKSDDARDNPRRVKWNPLILKRRPEAAREL